MSKRYTTRTQKSRTSSDNLSTRTDQSVSASDDEISRCERYLTGSLNDYTCHTILSHHYERNDVPQDLITPTSVTPSDWYEINIERKDQMHAMRISYGLHLSLPFWSDAEIQDSCIRSELSLPFWSDAEFQDSCIRSESDWTLKG